MAFLGALLTLAGIALSGAFLLSGADGLLPPGPASASLGPYAGSRLLAVGGVLAYLLGLALLGRLERTDGKTCRWEALILASSGLGIGFGIWLVLAIRADLDLRLVGALLGGLIGQSVVALGIVLKLAIQGGPRKLLFVPGVLATILLLVFDLLVLALGAG